MAEQKSHLSNLFRAAIFGDVKAVHRIMPRPLKVAKRVQIINSVAVYDGCSFTALTVAIRFNQLEVVKKMLEGINGRKRAEILSKASVIRDIHGSFHVAAEYNTTAVMIFTLFESMSSADIMKLMCEVSTGNMTPLHIATARDAHSDLIKALLDWTTKDQRMTLLSRKDNDENTPIHIAAKFMHNTAVMGALWETLDSAEKMLLLCMRNKNQWTPIHKAAQHSADAMKVMLETLNTEQIMTLLGMEEVKGWTPVHLAAQYSADAMKVMLETSDTGQRMTLLCLKKENGSTALHIAAQTSADAMKVLLETLNTEQIMTLLCMKEVKGWTPVHVAAQHCADAMKVMLETLEAEQNMTLLSIKNKYGSTPVHLAAQFNPKSMHMVIQPYDADRIMALLCMKGKDKWTPIHTASRYSAESIEEMLTTLDIEQKMKLLNMETCNGLLPVQIAATFGGDNSKKILTTILSYILEQLATGQSMVREHHPLLWTDSMDNNYLHFAAILNKSQFIRRVLYTQGTQEINEALLKRNTEGLTPYYLANNQETQRLLAWSETQLRCYPLVAPPRVVVFYTSQDRPGSKAEKDSILKTLETLSIQPDVVENPTERDVYGTIRANQTGEVSALIVVIMSHGAKGVVNVADGQLSINTILLQMDAEMLNGIPKILILQACQNKPSLGDLSNKSTTGGFANNLSSGGLANKLTSGGLANRSLRKAEDTTTEPGLEWLKQFEKSGLDTNLSDSIDASLVSRLHDHYDVVGPDIAVLAATINKHTATRDLMIPLLAKHLESASLGEDLHEVFLKTADELRNVEPVQVPEYRTSMRYKLCLRNIFNPEVDYKTAVKYPLP